jgi:hypothetical protein
MKTIQYILTLCFILFISITHAQFFNITKQKVYGTYFNNEVRGIDTINSKVVMAIGTSAISADNDKTCFIGNSDAWVVCFDSDLNEIWQNCYGGVSTEYINDIVATTNNEILIAITSQSGIGGNKTLNSFGVYDFWLVKTDANGTIQNQFVYGGSDDEFFSKILLLNDGYLLCGTSKSPISGNKTTPNRGNSDYWVIKIDFNGNKVWEKVFGGTGYDGLSDVIAIPGTDKILLYGESDSPIGFEKTKNSYGYSDYWLLMIDTTGSVIWDQTVGTNETEQVLEKIEYLNNALFLVSKSNASAIGGTKTCTTNGISDVWITKLDLGGNILWNKCIGGDGIDGCASVSVKNNMLWLGCSSSSNISGNKSENSKGSLDYWLLAIDTSANILFQKTIGGNNIDFIGNLFFLQQNKILMTGFSNSPVSGDKTVPPFGTEDLWFVQAEVSVGIEENIFSNTYHIYPNPVGNYLHIENKNLSLKQILISDISGKQILKQNAEHNKELMQINTENLKNGFYLLQLTDVNKNKTVLKLVKN